MATTLIMSDYLENQLINHIFRNIPYTPPAYLYMALYSVEPSDSDTGTELSGGGYSRVQCPSWNVVDNAAFNSSTITFPAATGNWGIINWFGIRDAPTGGNLLFYGEITNPQNIVVGNTLLISTNNLRITFYGKQGIGGWGSGTVTTIMNFILNNENFTSPGTSLYMALGKDAIANSTNNITGFTEVSAGDYSRKAMGGSGYWETPVNGITKNVEDILFTNTALEDWGTVNCVVFFNSSSSGDILLYGIFATPITIILGDGVRFNAQKITISLY